MRTTIPYQIFASTFFCFLSSCSLFHKETNVEPNNESFISLKASGHIVPIGSSASPMFVKLSSDFQISKTEVTKESFQKLMGFTHPNTELDRPNDPVRLVSWLDAIVYCNQLSKSLHLDTVYHWTSITRKENGSIQSISGLQTDWSIEGVRLPTEAEWNYAAGSFDSAAWSAQSWTAENSEGNIDSVGSLASNSNGIYDMGGNLMEWVYDTYVTPVKGDTLTDFAGLVSDPTQGNRVLKGGSYVHPLLSTNPAVRTDTYPRISSDIASYIGFRVVIGSIPKANYLDANGGLSQALQVANATTIQAITNFLHRLDFQLVFVDRASNHLCVLNTSGLIVYPDTGSIQHPTISPDGKWITYGTIGEGQNGNGSTWIRSINSQIMTRVKISEGHIPRWWINPSSGDTTLLILESAASNASASWNNSHTWAFIMHNGIPDSTPQIVSATGSWNGGITTNGRWLASGYTQLLLSNRKTGHIDTLFLSPQNGKSVNGSSQACNVSLASSDSPRLLFLDFGYPDSSTIVGRTYGIHEFLFFADSTGKIDQTIPAPTSYLSWDYPEWASSGNFAVAVSRNNEDAATAAWIINTYSKSTLQVLSGTEIGHPWLWVSNIQVDSSINLDSAGRYGSPDEGINRRLFGYRALQFWKRSHDKFYVLGNSQAADGFDPSVFSDSGSNLGVGGGDHKLVSELVDNYILIQRKPIWIGFNLELEWLTQADGYYWNNGVANSIGHIFDQQHDFWRNGTPSGWQEYLDNLPYPDIQVNVGEGGLFKFPSQGWGDSVLNNPTNTAVPFDDVIIQQNLDSIKALALRIRASGIHCVLFNTPISPSFARTSYYSTHGLSRSTAQQIITIIKTFVEGDSLLHFYDANNMGDHDYLPEDAYDAVHLSATGARKFSSRLRDSLIKWGVPTQ